MDISSPYAIDFPLMAPADAHWTDTVVTQGHADYCAEHGHASWVDNGVDVGRCPRCGVDTRPATEAAPVNTGLPEGEVIYTARHAGHAVIATRLPSRGYPYSWVSIRVDGVHVGQLMWTDKTDLGFVARIRVINGQDTLDMWGTGSTFHAALSERLPQIVQAHTRLSA